MTDQEKSDLEVGRATRELSETNIRISELREKTNELADVFETVAKRLRAYNDIRKPVTFPNPFPTAADAELAIKELHAALHKQEECQVVLQRSRG